MTDDQLPTHEDRRLLRDSIRNFLETHWPAGDAVKRADDPEEIQAIARRLAEQGLASLGSDPSEGGLQEILILQEELGRAGCPVPLLASSLASILLCSRASNNAIISELLGLLHEGKALTAMAFGSLDGDRTSGAVSLKEGRISGEARYLDMAHCATHFILVTSPTSIAVVDARVAGVNVMTTRAFGAHGLATVRFGQAGVLTTIEVEAHELEDLALIQRLALTARAFGAADRAFELVVPYARERQLIKSMTYNIV